MITLLRHHINGRVTIMSLNNTSQSLRSNKHIMYNKRVGETLSTAFVTGRNNYVKRLYLLNGTATPHKTRQAGGQADGWMDGWIDGSMDG